MIETKNTKILKSTKYNYVFNKNTGFFMRWGSNMQKDPDFSPFGPEIADIEVSTICHGIGTPCTWCYKSNTPRGENMNLETFKKVFHKLPKSLTQIAFGIGDLEANPDLFKMMHYCKNNDYNYVVPNITINGYNLTNGLAKILVKYCGAVAVSHYDDKICFEAIKKLGKYGLKQVNIHKLLSVETFDSCLELIDKAKEDYRLKDLNAIVFLLLKPKGKRNTLTPMKSIDKMQLLIEYAKRKDVSIGFDSCSAPTVLKAAKAMGDYKNFNLFVEPCESFHFSIYINAKAKVYACSFLEGEKGYEPINIIEANDFVEDVWMSEEAKKFRKSMKKNELESRMCPYFDLY